MAQVEEICRTYPVDGLWFDIYRSEDICYCDQCRKDMLAEGFDIEEPQDAQVFRALSIRRHAIRYEAASMIAFGARCNIGDQLHPLGFMDMTTYENIGHAYDYVEKIEDYGVGGLPESTLGIWLANEIAPDDGL